LPHVAYEQYSQPEQGLALKQGLLLDVMICGREEDLGQGCGRDPTGWRIDGANFCGHANIGGFIDAVGFPVGRGVILFCRFKEHAVVDLITHPVGRHAQHKGGMVISVYIVRLGVVFEDPGQVGLLERLPMGLLPVRVAYGIPAIREHGSIQEFFEMLGVLKGVLQRAVGQMGQRVLGDPQVRVLPVGKRERRERPQ